MTEEAAPPGSLVSRLFAPRDIASLVAFRVLFGLLMFGGLTRFLLQGWVFTQYVQPRTTFHYFGFSWVPRWDAEAMRWHVMILAGLALCIAAGFCYRVAAPLFAIGFAWIQLIDVTNYLNHYYLVILVSGLVALLPLHRSASVDAWWRPGLRVSSLPAWMLYLLRFQFAVVYVFGGLAKLGSDWLLHAQPLGIWLAARTDTPLIGPMLGEAWAAYALSWGGFLFDLTIVGFLLYRKTRAPAYVVVLVFHFLTHVFFDIGLFPFIMVIGATLFFEADWPRRWWKKPGVALPTPLPVPSPRRRHILVGALAVYCLFQAAFPLRHYLYPGDVIWSEEGMRFAWKIMLREKNGSVAYRVRDPSTGREWQVSPTDYVEWRQANEMSAQPDLILQLAHRIAERFEKRGVPNVEVRTDAWVSLNGRPPALIIDPSVDLAKIKEGIGAAHWILPAPRSSPLTAGRSRPQAHALSTSP